MESNQRTEWQIKVSLFRNYLLVQPLVTLSLLYAAGLLLGFFSVRKIVTEDIFLVGLILWSIFYLLNLLFFLSLFSGKRHQVYILDEQGIFKYSSAKKIPKGRFLSYLVNYFYYMRSDHFNAGDNFYLQGKELGRIAWKDILKVKYNFKRSTIMVNSGFSDKMLIHCHPDEYDEIRLLIRKKMIRTDMERQKLSAFGGENGKI